MLEEKRIAKHQKHTNTHQRLLTKEIIKDEEGTI